MKKEQYLGLPPYNEEAERAILSAILNKPSKLIEVKGKLTKPEHFYIGSHSAIYSAMLKLNEINQQIDLVNVSTYLRERELLEVSGGYTYLLDIVEEWHPAFNTDTHVKTVEAMYLARESIKSMAINTEKLYEEPSNAENILNEHCNNLSDFLASRTTSGLEHCKDSVIEVFENFSKIKEGDFSLEKELKVSTGYEDLDYMLNGLRRGSLYILGGRPAQGKELDVATPLLTPNGWLPIGESKIGDKIIGSDGQHYFITNVFPQGKKDVYRIYFDDGTFADAGLEHQWEVHTRKTRRYGKPSVVLTTKDMLDDVILSDRRKNYSIKINNAVVFDEQNQELPKDPYLLGIFIGDGYLKEVTPIICNPEKDIIKKIGTILPDGDILRSRDHLHHSIKNPINSKRSSTSKILFELGYENTRSNLKFIPKQYLHSSIENRIRLLQGITDSDGYVVLSNKSHIEVATVSEQLCEDILFLVRSLGGKASFKLKKGRYKKDGKHINCQDYYRITFSMGSDIVPVSSEKHLFRYGSEKRYHKKYITRIEKLDIQKEMICISVNSPDSLYIIDGFNLTHNTSVSLNIATNVAKIENLPVIFISLEMIKTELISRIICGEAEVPVKKLQYNATTDDEFKRFSNATVKVGQLPIFIDDKDIASVSKIKAKLQALRQKHKKLGLVVIDYLQLMQSDDPKETNPTIVFDKISRDLKRMAVEFNVPVLVLSQLSREVEKRNNKRPMLSDLRSSGQIEANANVVMFIYRDEYYNPEEADPGGAELIIAKNREGVTGTVDLFFDASITKFSALEKV